MRIDTPDNLKDRAKLTGIRVLPKNFFSRAFGAISDVRLPKPVRGVVNRGFALYAGIDVSESEKPPNEYASLNAFFTRKLRDGVHEANGETEALNSPCDGRLSEFGPIEDGTLIQAKGRRYTLVDLLDSAPDAQRFVGGSFATIYLSPRDYHRVHTPIAGTVNKVSYIPGHLFPVNPLAVSHIDQLFAVNERLVGYLETRIGDVAVIMVGATCVGRMTLSFCDLQTNASFRKRGDTDLEETLGAGDEFGTFNLGSTVILLIQNPNVKFGSDRKADQPIRLGQKLGSI